MTRAWPRLVLAALFVIAFVAIVLPALADGRPTKRAEVATGAEVAKRAVPPARLMVEAREFNLVLSRQDMRAGPAIVQLVVRGEDGHDLHIVRRSGGAARTIAETRPGDTATWSGSLRRGRYRLFCSLAGHERLGMRATVRVR
jgi:uncharacterized cupredoxin-like copper-binding protein